jgi:release factor glutamine methyltransferase
MMEWATDYFQQKQIPSPRLSIEWLLSHVLGIKRLQLYLQYDRPLTTVELDELREMVRRRAKHEPLQYITGSTAFFNAEIFVNPSVLIPRPETEELVEMVLNDHPTGFQRVLDIGTGSGCIPIALKMERPEWQVSGVDISTEALRTARRNADHNNADITLLQGDLFDPGLLVGHTFDIIVSNPPYIHHDEAVAMDRQVKDFEPELALFCNVRSDVYNSIIKISSDLLKPNGRLYLELHHDHHIEDEIGLKSTAWDTQILNDLGGSRRFLRAILKG